MGHKFSHATHGPGKRLFINVAFLFGAMQSSVGQRIVGGRAIELCHRSCEVLLASFFRLAHPPNTILHRRRSAASSGPSPPGTGARPCCSSAVVSGDSRGPGDSGDSMAGILLVSCAMRVGVMSSALLRPGLPLSVQLLAEIPNLILQGLD